MAQITKARFWCGVLYQENMVQNWEENIADLLQLPYAYCCHTLDVDNNSEHRKDHVHLIIVFPNTTTYKHAMNVFSLLSADGQRAINTCQAVIGIRNQYDYLIHDTDNCRKKGKYLYDKSLRIIGNNFDIGSYEQLDMAQKNDMCKELCNVIMEQGFLNFGDFYLYVISNYDDINYFEIIKSYSGLFERLTKSNYQKWQFNK